MRSRRAFVALLVLLVCPVGGPPAARSTSVVDLLDDYAAGRFAEAAYRGAVAAVPHAQSATIALAALTFRDGRREEAYRLIGDMLSADPPPLDPARAYVHADDRFWPYLVEKLRQEIQRHGLHGSRGFEP